MTDRLIEIFTELSQKLEKRNKSESKFFNMYKNNLINTKEDIDYIAIKNNLSGIIRYGDFDRDEYNLIMEALETIKKYRGQLPP